MANVDCIWTFVRIHYPIGRRRLVRHQPSPPSCRWSRSRDHRSRPRSRLRWTLSPAAPSLVVPTISSTFSSKSAIAKFRNAHQTKMADVDCIRTFVRIHYPIGRRCLVRHQPSPPSCRRIRPRHRRDRRSRRRSCPRRTLSPPAASLVAPTISSTFSSKSAIAKFRNAHQTKMAHVDSNIQHRYVTLKNHCT